MRHRLKIFSAMIKTTVYVGLILSLRTQKYQVFQALNAEKLIYESSST